jgi:hypothetical protein
VQYLAVNRTGKHKVLPRLRFRHPSATPCHSPRVPAAPLFAPLVRRILRRFRAPIPRPSRTRSPSDRRSAASLSRACCRATSLPSPVGNSVRGPIRNSRAASAKGASTDPHRRAERCARIGCAGSRSANPTARSRGRGTQPGTRTPRPLPRARTRLRGAGATAGTTG